MTIDRTRDQARRKAAVDRHRAMFGDLCPGLDDSGEHDVAPPNQLVAGTARDDLRAVAVLCRACVHVLRERQDGEL